MAGRPGPRYPWPWSVVRWVEGVSAEEHPLDADQSPAWGQIMRSLHDADPPHDGPLNPFRGIPLGDRSEAIGDRLERLESLDVALPFDLPRLRRSFERAAEVDIDGSPTWLHGDLHARNVICQAGAIAGIIDWGDLCVGDPATDLASLWILFEPHAHAGFWDAYGTVSPATHERARGWALFFGIMLFDSAVDNDHLFAETGRQTLQRALA